MVRPEGFSPLVVYLFVEDENEHAPEWEDTIGMLPTLDAVTRQTLSNYYFN